MGKIKKLAALFMVFAMLAGSLSITAFSANQNGANTTAAATSAPLLLGDVNGDGKVDVIDASLALQYDAGLIELSIEAALAGDVNGDGNTDVLDASLILQYDAGLITEFPGDNMKPSIVV